MSSLKGLLQTIAFHLAKMLSLMGQHIFPKNEIEKFSLKLI